jgi:hypothetical protein
MNQDNVMNLIDELRFRADKTLAYLEQMNDKGDAQAFEKDVKEFYYWLTHNFRPELYNVMDEANKIDT